MVSISYTVEGAKGNIRSGRKTSTIRRYNEKRFKMIERCGILHHYWKLRTKDCELIAVTKLYRIDVFRFDRDMNDRPEFWLGVANKDGFENVKEMLDWFYSHYGEQMYDMDFMRICW